MNGSLVGGRRQMSVTKRGGLTLGIAAVAALLMATACGSSGTTASRSTSAAPSAGSSSSASASQAHNQQDVAFVQQMIPHHRQAIEMSDIILAKQNVQNINPRVGELANQIKAAQGPEIQQMQGWLSQWGEPTMPMMPSGATTSGPTNMPGMAGMPDHSGMPRMNGMMSDQDMAALKDAQGIEESKLFLTQMIRHHQGAVAMAQEEIRSGQNQSAIALAHSIATSQQQEIDHMQAMLATL